MNKNGWHDILSDDDLPKESGDYLIAALNGGYYKAHFNADIKRWNIFSPSAIVAWHLIPEYIWNERRRYSKMHQDINIEKLCGHFVKVKMMDESIHYGTLTHNDITDPYYKLILSSGESMGFNKTNVVSIERC